MTNNLFGINMAQLLAQNMGQYLVPITLVKVIGQSRTTGALTAGTNPQSTSYVAKGMVEDYSEMLMSLSQINDGDRKVMILAGTLPSNIVPQPGDQVIAEGYTYDIIRVNRDPAAATYTCQVRGST